MTLALPQIQDAIGQPADRDQRPRANSILRSPRHCDVESPESTPRVPAIHKCFHLGSNYSTGVPNIEKIRARKITKMKAEVRAEDEQNPDDRLGAIDPLSGTSAMNTTAPGSFGSLSSMANESKASTVSPTGLSITKGDNMKNFCGITSPRSNYSVSSTGSWYFNRRFHETERLQEAHARGRSRTGHGAAGIGEGERFLLRRCKAILMRRHGTLNCALKRLGVDFARGLTLEEFTMASESFFKPTEARYIFRCLDAKHGQHRVSMEQLLNRLEELCLDNGVSSSFLT